MRFVSLSVVRLTAAVLLGLTGAPAALAVDCDAQPSGPVEQTVCDQPALKTWDARMNQRLADIRQARPALSDVLTRDQTHWWADTVNQAWHALATNDPATSILVDRYRQRLDYLEALGRASASDDDRADRLAYALATASRHAKDDLIDALARSKTLTKAATRTADTPKALWSAWSITPASGLSQAVAGLGGSTTTPIDGLWLASAGIGVVYRLQGSAACRTEQWFKVDDQRHAYPIASPSMTAGTDDSQGSCGERLALLAFEGHPIALQIADISVDERRVRFQSYAHDAWQKPRTWIARFDHRLGTPVVAHRADSGSAFWQRRIAPLAAAFDRHPEPGFTRSALSPANRDRIRLMRDKVRAGTGGQPYVQAPLVDDQSVLGAYDSFDEAAVFFPTAALNNWLLARVGTAHAGWRDNGDWLLGFWTLDADDTLVPLAGARVPRRRAAYLGSALLAGPGSTER